MIGEWWLGVYSYATMCGIFIGYPPSTDTGSRQYESSPHYRITSIIIARILDGLMPDMVAAGFIRQ